MYSKLADAAGLALIAVGVGILLGFAAGLIAGGVGMIVAAGLIDDDALGSMVRRGKARVHFAYLRRVERRPVGEARAESESPHPPIRVDPESQAAAERAAKARLARSKRGDRTPALSRQEPDEVVDGDLERIA